MLKISRAVIFISLGALVTLLGLLVWWQQVALRSTSVTFLDVGQGDAILIQQGHNQILIDGGKDSRQLVTELGRHMPFWDRTIEVVMPTHPDADHIGGLAGAARVYRVRQVLYTGATSETDFYKNFTREMEQHVPRDRWQKISRGTKLHLPNGGLLTVLYPTRTFTAVQKDEDANAGSLVIRFEYGETSFLLTGDLPREEFALGKIAPVTVLKAAHHGSRFSTSDAFVDMVQPKEAIISVGPNTYGHPHPSVMERLQKRGVRIHRTDEEGSITYQCINEERCEYQSDSFKKSF